MSTLVGMQLNGRYRLDAQIGAGGMSTVYRAFDAVLERRVAVKLMHREIAADTDQLERFRREARAVAQLSHPHIVGVIDAGEEDGRPYIVFEYVEGETLKDRIRRMGRLPIDESIAYAIEIARALSAAHARHIVHRDVKPQNVLIDEEGSAKVTDFGIARSLDEEGLTAEGRVLGTTDYVSPEQALGHAVNGQSDIYSLGVVLFEMLTGDVPFHGENQVAVAMKHVREDLPDVQMRRPEVSAGLAAILDRMTDKHLEHRYPDAHTLEVDLEDALAVEAARSGRATGEATAVIATLPESARRRVPFRLRRRIPVIAVVGALLLAGGVLAVVLLQGLERTPARHRRGQGPGAARHPRRLRQAHERPGLRPARRRRRARRPGLARRRQGPRHGLDDRELQRRHDRRQGRRRPLHRRRARGHRHQDRARHADARLAGRDPRRGGRPGARRRSRRRQRVAARRRRHRQAQAPALHAPDRGQALPLLPRLDHEAPRGRGARRALRRLAVPQDRELSALRTRGPRAPRGSAPPRAPAAGRRPPGTSARWPPTSSGSRSWPSCPAAC